MAPVKLSNKENMAVIKTSSTQEVAQYCLLEEEAQWVMESHR